MLIFNLCLSVKTFCEVRYTPFSSAFVCGKESGKVIPHNAKVLLEALSPYFARSICGCANRGQESKTLLPTDRK